MLVTFTDFGPTGPYLGQMIAVLKQRAPGVEVVDLINNAPAADPKHSAYLLAALARWWPQGTVFLCVVDPGVGTSRLPVALNADGKWFVGPDNGLLNTVAVQGSLCAWYRIVWQPKELSSSFHGRDLFAPVAAWLATGRCFGILEPWSGPELASWPSELSEVIYLDAYGNAITGLKFHPGLSSRKIRCGDLRLSYARTFGEVAQGTAFWYGNSMGLVEIAVNLGSAADLGLKIGQRVDWA
ncbi:MAG: S-adenosyl-l-methionine hydroxide adenosyltransferase family protein [Methylohalobius sp.]